MTENEGAGPEIINLDLVREALEGAEPAPAMETTEPMVHGVTALQAANNNPPVRPGSRLPDGCPVTPLGKGPGVCYYLDANRQLMALKAKDHSRLGVRDLFGADAHLAGEFWPRVNKDGEPIGTDWDKVAEALGVDAAASGIWNPLEKVRGPGAWRGDDGGLILHCGDAIITGGQTIEPGLIGREVYPAAEPLPRPTLNPVPGGDHGPGVWLLDLLKRWTWQRPGIDPELLLGWIGAAMIGGALKWRPAAWITGGQGTGKSTLHEILKGLFGGALVGVTDASAAGIWQKLGHATLPVALDELESEADNRKGDNIVKLARQAASGGGMLRGGQDHKGTEFVVRSCFLFSSILMPAMESQDLSRLAILELGKLPAKSVLRLDQDKLGEVGTALRRRLVDGWCRLEETLEIYASALIANGHDARGADQFGVLLACADLLMHDGETNGEYAREMAEKLKACDLAEWADAAADELGMLSHITTMTVDVYREGRKRTIGEWIEIAAGVYATLTEDEGNQVLGSYGLMVEANDDGQKYLAIANQHSGLAAIFKDTKWRSRPGRPGGWVQSARRIDGSIVPKTSKWIGGGKTRYTLVPLEAILGGKAPEPAVLADKAMESGESDDVPF